MKIKLFNISFDKVIYRYYLMMFVVIASFYAGIPLIALLALPIFLSAILGMDFKLKTTRRSVWYPNTKENESSRFSILTYPIRFLRS